MQEARRQHPPPLAVLHLARGQRPGVEQRRVVVAGDAAGLRHRPQRRPRRSARSAPAPRAAAGPARRRPRSASAARRGWPRGRSRRTGPRPTAELQAFRAGRPVAPGAGQRGGPVGVPRAHRRRRSAGRRSPDGPSGGRARPGTRRAAGRGRDHRGPGRALVRVGRPGRMGHGRSVLEVDALDDHDFSGRSEPSVVVVAMESTTARDSASATSPKIVCRRFRCGVGPTVMKNWEPLVPGPGVGHGQQVGPVEAQVGVELVGELVAGAAHPGAGRVTTLDHESADHPVEHRRRRRTGRSHRRWRWAWCSAFARGQPDEVVHRLGRVVGEQVDPDVAVVGPQRRGVLGSRVRSPVHRASPSGCASSPAPRRGSRARLARSPPDRRSTSRCAPTSGHLAVADRPAGAGPTAASARLGPTGTTVSSVLCTISVGGRTRGRSAEQVEAIEVDPDPAAGGRGGQRGQPGWQPPVAGLLAQRLPPVDERAVPHDRGHRARLRRAVQERPDDRRAHGPAEQHDPPRAAVAGPVHRRLEVCPFGVAQVVATVRAGRRLLVVAVGDGQRRVPGPVQGRQHPQCLPPRTTPAVHQDHPGVAGGRDVPGRALAPAASAPATWAKASPRARRVRVVRAGVQHRRACRPAGPGRRAAADTSVPPVHRRHRADRGQAGRLTGPAQAPDAGLGGQPGRGQGDAARVGGQHPLRVDRAQRRVQQQRGVVPADAGCRAGAAPERGGDQPADPVAAGAGRAGSG